MSSLSDSWPRKVYVIFQKYSWPDNSWARSSDHYLPLLRTGSGWHQNRFSLPEFKVPEIFSWWRRPSCRVWPQRGQLDTYSVSLMRSWPGWNWHQGPSYHMLLQSTFHVCSDLTALTWPSVLLSCASLTHHSCLQRSESSDMALGVLDPNSRFEKSLGLLTTRSACL